MNSKSVSGLFFPASFDFVLTVTMEPLKERMKFANPPQPSKNAKYDSPQQTSGGGHCVGITVSKKYGALFRSLKFLSLEFAFYLH